MNPLGFAKFANIILCQNFVMSISYVGNACADIMQKWTWDLSMFTFGTLIDPSWHEGYTLIQHLSRIEQSTNFHYFT